MPPFRAVWQSLPVRCFCFVLVVAVAQRLAPNAWGQMPLTKRSSPTIAPQVSSAPYAIVACLMPGDRASEVFLVVDVKLAPGHYLYSLTQPGGLATEIEVALGKGFQIQGPLYSSAPPHHVAHDAALAMALEKHYGDITFYLPLRRPSLETSDARVLVRINGQICSDQGACFPLRNYVLSATDDSASRRNFHPSRPPP